MVKTTTTAGFYFNIKKKKKSISTAFLQNRNIIIVSLRVCMLFLVLGTGLELFFLFLIVCDRGRERAYINWIKAVIKNRKNINIRLYIIHKVY